MGLVVIIGVVLLGSFALMFNRLVRLRNLMREAWSLIEVQLKKRHDLIPQLQETVKAYGLYEKDVLENVTAKRVDGADAQTASETENALSKAIKSLLVLAEAYPNLKADQNYRTFQEELVKVEDDLEMARRYYNGTVRNYNVAVQSFPSNLAARAFGFSAAAFFEIELATERQAPAVRLS